MLELTRQLLLCDRVGSGGGTVLEGFCREGGVRLLLDMASLDSAALRVLVLDVVVALVSCDPATHVQILPRLMEMLCSAGGTAALDESVLLVRTQLMDCLLRLYKVEPDTAVMFREHGGFTWILAVLAGIGKALRDGGPDGLTTGEREAPDGGPDGLTTGEREAPFRFAMKMLDLMALSMTRCPANQEYLRTAIGMATLSDVVQNTGFFCNNRYLLDMVRSFFK